MMERLTWILTFFCAAGCHLSSASPVRSSTLVVQAGQNVSLPCNLTSSVDLTWYLLRSEQLLPLFTLKSGIRGKKYTTDFHTNNSRIKYEGDVQSSLVSLEIKEVEEDDAGLYFCIGRYSATVHVSRGIQLTVDGAAGGSSTDQVKQPCLGLGLCVLPVLLALCFICMAGFYLWSGKSSCSSCNPGRRDTGHGVTEVTEEESLHYSSLKHPHKPRPAIRRGAGLVEDNVVYSTVNSCKNSNAQIE